MAFSEAYTKSLRDKGLQSGNYGVAINPSFSAAAKPIPKQQIIQPKKSVAAEFANKVGAVGGQTFDIGRTIAAKGTSFAVNTAIDVAKQAKGAYTALNPQLLQEKQRIISQSNKQLELKQKSVIDAYKTGKMSKDNYIKAMRGFSDAYSGLSKEAERLQEESDPNARASDLAWTAINIATAGGLGLVKAGAKPVAEGVIKKSLQKGIENVENVVLKVPAAKELMERNAAKVVNPIYGKMKNETTEQWMARSGKQITIGLLIKRPLFYQQNIGLANEAYQKILDGEYQDALTPAAWLGAQMVGGGPLLAGAKWTKAKVGELSKGKGSFIDELSKMTATNLAKHIQDVPESMRTWRIAQATNMTASNNNAYQAAQSFLQPYIQAGVDLKSITEKELTEGMAKWAQADELRIKRLSQGLIKGVDPSEVDKYAVVRWDTVMKDGLNRELTQDITKNTLDNNDKQALLDKLIKISERPGVGWGNNESLVARLQDIIYRADTIEDMAKKIKQIDTAAVAVKGMPKKIAKEFADLGYTLAAPFGGNRITRLKYDDIENTTQKIVTGAVKNETDIFNPAISPQPALQAISGALTKAGLSPEGNAQIANRKLSEALIADIGDLGLQLHVGLVGKDGDFVNGGRAILSELQRYVETKKGAFGVNKISSGKSAVTDIRQLTNDEISTALNITKTESAQVSRAIRNAYTKVPLEFRGLGDKIVDYATAMPKSPMRYYQRIQSALRYTYNPFFRLQEQVETKVLASMDANKFIWAHKGLDDTVKRLEDAGVFKGNVFGAGADDAVIGRISANLTKYQKRNLAGLAETIAKGQSKSVDDILRDNPEQIEDALRVIVQYPKEGTLASPLARTINLAFFPMRYNAKVATLAAEKLSTMPPSIQFATVQAIYKTKEWLKSDEGIQWQAKHADAIQVWSWATPTGNISQFYKLLSGNIHAPGELGLIGGLPFGVVSQILDGQGIINLNKPYVNPATGDVIPDYIPQTTRARAAVAMQDLLGTMFSFPGRTLGLPGKEANLRKAVGLFIDTNGKDFDKRLNMEELTPLQRDMVRVLKGDTSDEAVSRLYYNPAPGQFDYYTIPPIDLPITRPLVRAQPALQRRTGLPEKPKKVAGALKTKPLPIPITR